MKSRLIKLVGLSTIVLGALFAQAAFLQASEASEPSNEVVVQEQPTAEPIEQPAEEVVEESTKNS